MEALFVFGFLFVMIIKHVGACIKEDYEIRSDRQRAIAEGKSTFYTVGGERDTATGHKIKRANEGYFGWSITDQVTGQKKYHELEEVLRKFEKEKDDSRFICSEHDDVWQGYLNGNTVYIDRTTKQIMYLAYANTMYEYGRGLLERYDTYFYVDFFNRSHVIRKTKKQLSFEQKWPTRKWYSMDEINNFIPTDKTYRDDKGNWKPIRYDLRDERKGL